jgi:hypothetical protein
MNRRLALLFCAAVVVFVGACSSGSPTATSTRGGPHVAGSGVDIEAPSGWTSQDGPVHGLVVAMRPTDLEAEVPGGPRLVASASTRDLPDPADLFATAREQGAAIRAAPATITVGGISGVAVESAATVGGTTIVSRRVVVPLGGGQAEVFVLEAPADQWDANRATLEGILASVRFTTPVIEAPGS